MKQLVCEQLVTVKTRRGFACLEWQKLRERNEALHCRVYARAAAWIAGADRWTEAMWRDLEQQVGTPDGPGDEQAAEAEMSSASIAGHVRRRPEQRGRRVFRSSYMSWVTPEKADSNSECSRAAQQCRDGPRHEIAAR
jgi:phage terminase large subunit GpA-like protein